MIVKFDIEKLLVIVAHPDDETLGAGGTIRLLSDDGVQVDLLVVTDGSSAQFGDDLEAQTRRNTHLAKACEILGISKYSVLDFPDMRLDTVPHIELNKAIGSVVLDGGYDAIFTHHPGDVNMDHQKVFDSVMVVARPMPGAQVRTLATFFINSSSEWGSVYAHRAFIPNIFVDITRTVDAKIAALKAYEDELRAWPHPRSAKAVLRRAQTVGTEAGLACGEAFQLLRCVIHAPLLSED